MSLAKADLDEIRSVILDVLHEVVTPRFDRIEAQLDEHSATLAEHTRLLNEHSSILNEHSQRLATIEEKVDNIDGRLQALEQDVKELYARVGVSPSLVDKKFAKLPPEQQLRQLYGAVVALAEQLHVEL